MRIFFLSIFLLSFIAGFCQISDTSGIIALQPVFVTAYKDEPLNQISLNITSLRLDGVHASGNYNLTDLLTQIPGINILSTGPAVVKPVIRGLYGNRILVLLSGLKFDNHPIFLFKAFFSRKLFSASKFSTSSLGVGK